MGTGPSDPGTEDLEVAIAEIRGRIDQLETVTEEANREILKRLDRIEGRQVDGAERVVDRLDALTEQLEHAEERIWELEAEIEDLREML